MSDGLTLALLAGASFIAALASASLSIGGGYILFGTTTLLYPLPSAIALQPVLSYASLLSRSMAFWKDIDWQIVRPFTAGSVVGVALGLVVYHAIPDNVLAVAVGVVMLVLAWTKPVIGGAHSGKAYAAVGGAHAMTGTVLGMGSVLQPVLLNSGIGRRAIVGTFATCLLVLEAIRLGGYAATGFAYGPFILPVVIATIAGIAGTWVGKALIGHIPEALFRLVLRLMVSALAVRLLALGFGLTD